MLAELALDGHLRRCRTCRHAVRRRQRLCAAGRRLLAALLMVSAPAPRAW